MSFFCVSILSRLLVVLCVLLTENASRGRVDGSLLAYLKETTVSNCSEVFGFSDLSAEYCSQFSQGKQPPRGHGSHLTYVTLSHAS